MVSEPVILQMQRFSHTQTHTFKSMIHLVRSEVDLPSNFLDELFRKGQPQKVLYPEH